MRTLLHTSDPAEPLVDLGDLDPAAKLADLVAVRDELLWLEDGEEPLDPTQAIREVVTVEHVEILHLHRHAHLRIRVEIRYHGRRVQAEYPPSTTLRRVERRAVRELGLAPGDAAELVLRCLGTDADLDPELHLGTLAGPRGEVVELDLVPAVHFAG